MIAGILRLVSYVNFAIKLTYMAIERKIKLVPFHSWKFFIPFTYLFSALAVYRRSL